MPRRLHDVQEVGCEVAGIVTCSGGLGGRVARGDRRTRRAPTEELPSGDGPRLRCHWTMPSGAAAERSNVRLGPTLRSCVSPGEPVWWPAVNDFARRHRRGLSDDIDHEVVGKGPGVSESGLGTRRPLESAIATLSLPTLELGKLPAQTDEPRLVGFEDDCGHGPSTRVPQADLDNQVQSRVQVAANGVGDTPGDHLFPSHCASSGRPLGPLKPHRSVSKNMNGSGSRSMSTLPSVVLPADEGPTRKTARPGGSVLMCSAPELWPSPRRASSSDPTSAHW